MSCKRAATSMSCRLFSSIPSSRATRTAHSASRVLCTPVLRSFKSRSWLKAQISEALRSLSCSLSSSTCNGAQKPLVGRARASVAAVRMEIRSALLQSCGFAPSGYGLVEVQAPVSQVGGEQLGVSKRLGRLVLITIHWYTEEQGRDDRNEWRAEGGTRTGRVGAEWIGGNNGFPGRGHPDNVLAVVGKGRSRVRIRSRGDAHY